MSNSKILNFMSQHGDKQAAAVEQELLDRTAELVSKWVQDSKDRNVPVLKYASPEAVRKAINISIGENPCDLDELVGEMKNVVDLSVRTGHPHFFNQLFAGLDIAGVAAEYLAVALNTSMYTFEMAPVFTQMEQEVLSNMMKYVGFKDAEGLCCPGGSYSNAMAIHTARTHYCKSVGHDYRKLGNGDRKLCFLTGEHAHYSMLKGSMLLGLGSDNCVKVKADNRGRMSAEDLQKRITELRAEGREPFCVVVTAGYTVSGAFDPIDECAAVCEKEGIWMHIDGSWGAGLACSQRERGKLTGSHRAQSITWNPHKMWNSPQQLSCVLINGGKNDAMLKHASAAYASYLFQPDKMYTEHDTGDLTMQCGRRVDVFKLWLSWKARGLHGYEAHVNNLMDCANYLKEQILARDEFRLVLDNECTNVCFYYLPKECRDGKLNKQTGEDAKAHFGQHDMFRKENNPELYNKLHKLASGIKRRMQFRGTTLCAYQPINGLPNFFRMVVINGRVTKKDMDFLLDEICVCADEVERGL